MQSAGIQWGTPKVSVFRPRRVVGVTTAFAALLALAGCGMPGAPLPPSLNLPARVTNLSAVRAGDQVALTWTMPTKNTDKTLIKPPVSVRVCRDQATTASCSAVTTLQLAPGADGAFTDALPLSLAAGPPRLLTYSVELVNRKGRSAGLSNGVPILAGQAPPAVVGLTAALQKNGVLLTWTPAPPEASPVAIRLVRKLLTPPAKKSSQGSLAQPAEPAEQNLLVEPGVHAGRALDNHIQFGETYEYRAQRVARITVARQTLELASPLSAPIRIDAVDIFPPGVPTGLVAVATAEQNGNPPSIDLNWLPDSGADLVGYIVYRRELPAPGETVSPWQRVSPAQPNIGPGYHDATVQPGHTYQYAVTAIGQNGHESARSAEAQETVPAS
ncbi:MAG: fibronectin type III domain-containing protein [Terracidiphilus sp.]